MRLEIIFCSAALSILIILVFVSFGYSTIARLLPLIVIIPTAILLGIQVIREVSKKARQKVLPEEKEMADKGIPHRYLRAPIWIGSLVISIYLLGYLVGTALFSFLYLKLHGAKWLTTISYVLGVIALIYGCFELALKMPLYEGVVFR